MMLAWMRYFATRRQNQRFVKFAKAIFGTDDLCEAAERFEAYIRGVGVQTRISQFGVMQSDLDALTQGLVDVSFGTDGKLASIPPVTRDEARAIYALAL